MVVGQYSPIGVAENIIRYLELHQLQEQKQTKYIVNLKMNCDEAYVNYIQIKNPCITKNGISESFVEQIF